MKNLLIATLAILFAIPAWAQTPATSTAGSAANGGVTYNKTDLTITVLPRQQVPITATDPQLVEFQLVSQSSEPVDSDPKIETASQPLDIGKFAGVTLRGYARFVPSTGPTLNDSTQAAATPEAQVIITGIRKEQKFVRLDGFGASWRVRGAAPIEPGRALQIRGNRKALEAALAELNAIGADGKEQDDDRLQVDNITPPTTASSGGASGSKEEKSDYKTPEPVNVADKTEALEERPERACIDGAIRIDTQLGVAFERRQVWLAAERKYADCFDSPDPAERYALLRNYTSCEARIDGGKAVARYQQYYVRGEQARIVGLCTNDDSLSFDIIEDHGNCPVEITAASAIPQADLGYVNRSGRRIQTRGCAPSTTRPPAPISTVTDSCNIRDELGPGGAAGRSVVRGMRTYTIAGVTHQVSICEDTETVYAHSVDYSGCQLEVDIAGRVVTAASRVVYRNGAGETVEVRGCQSDASRAYAISEDPAGCQVAIDYDAATATPQARLVYRDGAGRRVELRDCAPSKQVRPARLTADTSHCEMRRDFAALRTYERAKYTYRLAGGEFTAADCRETGRNFALVKNHAACPAIAPASVGARVDTRYRWSFTDQGGRERFAGDCESDESVDARVFEDFTACTVEVDYTTGKATPQSKLVYNNRNGQPVEARPCAASTSRTAVDLVADVASCTADIDIDNRVVVESARYSYVLAGVTHRASDCRPTGRNFRISRDDTSCEMQVNISALRATAAYRLVYADGGGETVEVRGCQPDASRAYTISEDAEGCQVAIDYDAATATPQARLVYRDGAGSRVELRDCAPSKQVRQVRLTADTSHCEMRNDLATLRTYERAIYTYRLAGGEFTAADCRETGRNFALVKNHAACPAIAPASVGARVDTRYRWSFTDQGGRERFAGDCESDESVDARVIEDFTACTVEVDYTTGKATPQSKLVYNNRNGQPVEARPCAASTSRDAVNLVADVASCTADIDIDNRAVAENARYSYILAGVTHRASDCRPTGRNFRISRDDTSCEMQVNISALRATAAYRLVYTDGAGRGQLAQDCTPDPSRVVSVREHFTACTIKIDFDANTATPQSRLVYSGFDGREVVARPCQDSATRAGVALQLETSGCQMRHDIPARTSFAKATYSYTLGGATTRVADCRETGQTFVIERGFSGCMIDVDIPELTATQRFAWFYVDEAGENSRITECLPDPELVFAIKEDHRACQIFINYQDLQAEPQSVLWYADRFGQRTEARGCEGSITQQPIPLVSRTDTCELEHDFNGSVTFQRGIHTYSVGDVTYQVGGCRRTGRSYAHQKVYLTASNQYVCDPIIDRTGATVTQQFRRRISVNGVETYISECTPDAAESRLAIISTTEGCTDTSLWTHNLESAVTYAQERFFYSRGSERIYVSACRNSAVTYLHDHRVVGYQNQDAMLSALPVTRVAITTTAGEFVINAGLVLPGAAQVPYTLNETTENPTGTNVYEGCNAYKTTQRVEHWRRPDSSIFQKPVGAGTRIGPRLACAIIGGASWTRHQTEQHQRTITCCAQERYNKNTGTNCVRNRTVVLARFQRYIANRRTRREDGEILRTEIGMGWLKSIGDEGDRSRSSSGRILCRGAVDAPALPREPTGVDGAQWSDAT